MISAAQVYGLLFVKVDFLLISLLEAMSEKPENMKNPKFGRVKVHKGKGYWSLLVKVDFLWDPHVEVMLKKAQNLKHRELLGAKVRLDQISSGISCGSNCSSSSNHCKHSQQWPVQGGGLLQHLYFIGVGEVPYTDFMNIDFGSIPWERITQQHFLLEFAVD